MDSVLCVTERIQLKWTLLLIFIGNIAIKYKIKDRKEERSEELSFRYATMLLGEGVGCADDRQ